MDWWIFYWFLYFFVGIFYNVRGIKNICFSFFLIEGLEVVVRIRRNFRF